MFGGFEGSSDLGNKPFKDVMKATGREMMSRSWCVRVSGTSVRVWIVDITPPKP